MTSKHEGDHLPTFRVRPRFRIESPYSIEQLLNIFRTSIDQEKSIKARIIEGYVRLYLPLENQHYWSPQLTLTMTEGHDGTNISGVYGPRPSVWTMFVFFYSFIGFAIIVVSIFGFSNWSLGNSAPILWLLPFLVMLFLTLYLISYFGQKLGHDQMIKLHLFVEQTIGHAIG